MQYLLLFCINALVIIDILYAMYDPHIKCTCKFSYPNVHVYVESNEVLLGIHLKIQLIMLLHMILKIKLACFQ